MNPLTRSRLYTLGMLSKSVSFQAPIFALVASFMPVVNPMFVLASFTATILALGSHFVLCGVSRGTPAKTDLVIHWTNTPHGPERTLDVGYANGLWGDPVFSSKIISALLPGIAGATVKTLLTCTYIATCLGAILAFEPAVLYEGEAVQRSFAMLAGIAATDLLILKLVFTRLRRRYLLSDTHWRTMLSAIISLTDRSPMFLDPLTGAARHCLQMDGHLVGAMKWTQHNSAEGDLY